MPDTRSRRTTRSLTLGLADGAEVLTVSGLNRTARRLIEDELGSVWVEGEISNLARPTSGHMYWSLKDQNAQVRCAMFRQANRRLGFSPEDGSQVLVRAKASIYEPRGDYQLIVDHMEEAGEGLLRRKFEALKQKLADEGLFDPARKRELPAIPARIGVITSPTGAALRDVLISLQRRFPATDVLVYPTSVQGDKAAGEIVAALERASARAECDLLILTRGGGSLEDLWPFNEEAVARAVDAVAIPIIVAVGHETDFTIAEFVADLRAPTPSQAAELAVPEQAELLQRIDAAAQYMERQVMRRLRDEQRRLDALEHRLNRTHPGTKLDKERVRLAGLVRRLRRAHPGLTLATRRQALERLELAMRGSILRKYELLAARAQLVERSLTALSPLATLDRGYAIVTRNEDGQLVTANSAVAAGDRINVRLADGELLASVESGTAGTTEE